MIDAVTTKVKETEFTLGDTTVIVTEWGRSSGCDIKLRTGDVLVANLSLTSEQYDALIAGIIVGRN